jgi:hypothetical protein
MTDEEFLTAVATHPNALEVSKATGYTVGYVDGKLGKLRKAGHTVEYGSSTGYTWTNVDIDTPDTDPYYIPPITDDEPELIYDGPTLHEFAVGWDNACAKLKALVEMEDAHIAAHAENATYQAGYHQGKLAGIEAMSDMIAEEENIDATMDRAMLLAMFPKFDCSWAPVVQKTWLKVWMRTYEMGGI